MRICSILVLLGLICGVAGVLTPCPSTSSCRDLDPQCMSCTHQGQDITAPPVCAFGANVTLSCSPRSGVNCTGPTTFDVVTKCKFCYQLPDEVLDCSNSTDCKVSSQNRMYLSTCRPRSNQFCFGTRAFPKRRACNWSSGKKRSTAFLLSVTVGGFGADRFYLGDYSFGIFKLFSFGGLGIWGVVDAILTAVGYLQPADGSALMNV